MNLRRLNNLKLIFTMEDLASDLRNEGFSEEEIKAIIKFETDISDRIRKSMSEHVKIPYPGLCEHIEKVGPFLDQFFNKEDMVAFNKFEKVMTDTLVSCLKEEK